MKYYKLLTQDLKSYNNTQWQIGVPVTVTVPGNQMCTDQVLHCYNHPLLAVLFSPIHVEIFKPRLFEISVDEIVNSDGLKFASKSQTLIKEIPLPEISTEQKVEFGIRTAKLVYKNQNWNKWADDWLSGKDRSRDSASTAFADAASTAFADAGYAGASCAGYAGASCAVYAAHAAADKNEFNQKMIDIIQEIVKVKE